MLYKLCSSFFFFFFFREKLQLEIAAREKAEKKHQEYEERLKQMQAEISKREQDLLSAQVHFYYILICSLTIIFIICYYNGVTVAEWSEYMFLYVRLRV